MEDFLQEIHRHRPMLSEFRWWDSGAYQTIFVRLKGKKRGDYLFQSWRTFGSWFVPRLNEAKDLVNLHGQAAPDFGEKVPGKRHHREWAQRSEFFSYDHRFRFQVQPIWSEQGLGQWLMLILQKLWTSFCLYQEHADWAESTMILLYSFSRQAISLAAPSMGAWMKFNGLDQTIKILPFLINTYWSSQNMPCRSTALFKLFADFG